MNRRRVRLAVEVDLDPVPGWGDTAEDWRQWLQGSLDNLVQHYHPAVTVEDVTQ